MTYWKYIAGITIGNALGHVAAFFILPDYTVTRVALNAIIFPIILIIFCGVLYLFGWRPYGQQSKPPQA